MSWKLRSASAGIAAGVVASIALGACGSGSSDSSTTGSSGGKTSSITVGISVDDASYAPLYLAVDKDMFAAHDLKVKLVVFQGGSDLVKGVVGGSVDVAVSALSGMIPAVEQHQPLKAFYGGFNMAPFAWYGQPGITSIKQGEGKKWGVSKVGSSTDFLTRYLLSKNGIDPTKDATIVGVGGGDGQLAAMKDKQIDVTIASPPTTYATAAAGYPVIARESDLVKEYPTQVVYSKSGFVADHKDEAQAFVEGLSQGITLAKNDPNAAATAIAGHEHVSQADALRAAKDDGPAWYADGRLPDQADMNVFWQIGVQNQEWPKALPDSQWLDSQFMDSYAQWSKGT